MRIRQNSNAYYWFILVIKVGLCCINLTLLFNHFNTRSILVGEVESATGSLTDSQSDIHELINFLSDDVPLITDSFANENLSVTNYKFIIFTKSYAEAHETRTFLREKSWLSYNWTKQDGSKISWKHFFLVGLSIDKEAMENLIEENDTHGDIIVSDTFTSLRHQAYKVMWMFEYAVKNLHYKFLIQVDDDTVVNVRLLDRFLTKIIIDREDNNLYVGANCARKGVIRDGPFRTSEEAWPDNMYPPYCSGAGTIFSHDVIDKIVAVWKDYRGPAIGHDDVLTGELAYIAGGIVPRNVGGIRLGYVVGQDGNFLLLAIRPLEIGAALLENHMNTGVYGNETVEWHG